MLEGRKFVEKRRGLPGNWGNVRLTGQLEGEVEGGQHDCGEDPPAEHARHERAGAAADLQFAGQREVTLGHVPEGAGEEAKGQNEGEEDADEDHVGPEGEDQVDEAQDAHEDKEEGCVKGRPRCQSCKKTWR